MYTRKTRDIYEIYEYVPSYGWEYSTSEETRQEARQQAKTYRNNNIAVKIVKKRERII